MNFLERIRAHTHLPILDGALHSTEWKRVPPDIGVSVTHDHAPIAGIEVAVVPVNNAGPVSSGTTDAHGDVYIRGLARGRYLLIASHIGFDAGKAWIEVVAPAEAPTIDHFCFHWDSDYQTRRVAGTLTGLAPGSTGHEWMDIAHPVRAVYGGVHVTLRNAFGTNEYRSLTDRNGQFQIDQVPDGIYVLTIEGGEQANSGTADETSRIVDVRSSAARDDLPLELRDTPAHHTEFMLHEN